ncbi:MAG: archaemetzincin family Zn-dependent metalloprotease [Endomicrobia bacterium]|nr:archaemetzincin family Zn-dependent metalloprotease [Endomicrobiia bacterium]
MIFLVLLMFINNTLISAKGKIYLSFVNIHIIDKEKVVDELSKIFGMDVSIIDTYNNLDFAYVEKRQQYLSDKILSSGVKYLPKDAKVLVFVIDKDIFTEGFNFIFGQSYGRVCIVSLNRFLPCSRIDNQDELKLIYERTIKTIIHEIGHSFGLQHCKNFKCVMFFSNWIGDTDRKEKFFCSSCRNQLKQNKLIEGG